jgi:hypothetical protein
MHITNYQMHNVLKVYTNHLSKERTHKSGQPKIRKPNSDMVRISAEGKRQNLIERVAADIVARITREGINASSSSEADIKKGNTSHHQPSLEKKNARFEYNVMHGSAKKESNSLSVENAGFLIRRIEELTGGSEPDEVASTSTGSDTEHLSLAIDYNI